MKPCAREGCDSPVADPGLWLVPTSPPGVWLDACSADCARRHSADVISQNNQLLPKDGGRGRAA